MTHVRIQKIISNLLSNAFKYTPQSGTLRFVSTEMSMKQ